MVPHAKLIRQLTKGMFTSMSSVKEDKENNGATSLYKTSIKKPIDLSVEDSASAKESREMILQTKLIVVELLQVFYFKIY